MPAGTNRRTGERAVDRIADALRSAGRSVKATRSGGGTHLQAQCPIHGADRSPSLSVDQHAGEDRARMYCHTCFDSVSERDLMEAIGLHYDELWDESGGECVWCRKRTIPLPGTGELIHPRCADRRADRPAGHTNPAPNRTDSSGHADRTDRLGGGAGGRVDGRVGGSVAQLPAPKPHPVKPGPLPGRLTEDWPQRRPTGRSRDAAFYEHDDVDGTILGRSVRTERQYEIVEEDGATQLEAGKGLRLEHPDHTRRSGWASGLPGAGEIPLWRPREVAAAIAAGEDVHLAEGHKNAQKLIDAGVVATTNINGAGSFNEQHAEQLRGAHVVQHCDRDLAGWRRALKCARLLDGVAASIRFVLPVPEAAKSDVYDHLDQGHTLAELIPVSLAEIETFALLGEAEQVLSIKYMGSAIPRELAARQRRAAAADDPAVKTAELKAADRWAVEAGKGLVKLYRLRTELEAHPARRDDQLAAVDTLLAQAGDITVAAYTACNLALPDDINRILAVLNGDDEIDDNTADLSSRIVPAPADPTYPLPISGRADWAYSLGENGTDRGVYYRAGAHHAWKLLGPLPHVEARLVRRDAADDKTGMDYLLAATPDGPTVIATQRTLADGSWAQQLGLVLSTDPPVMRAVATAIICHADRDVAEHEAAPRAADDGRIIMPPKLPTGWFDPSPADHDRALGAWRTIAGEMTPVMAHTVAASAFAPFLRDIGTQPHFISLSSGKGVGKTLTLQLAAAVWGNPLHEQTDLFDNWNTTAKGLPLILGGLRMLPAFRDEAGMAGLTPREWGTLIYTLTQGASRTRGTRELTGTRTSSWRGIIFATGNGEILAGAEGGVFDGLDRRVIDFAYPTFTGSREHAKRLLDQGRGLLADCYGHLGPLLLEQYTVTRVRELIAAADKLLSLPEGHTAAEVRDLMRTHIAGAMMLDELLGTGELLTAKTVAHAEDYLADLPEVTDGDRVLEVLSTSMASSPNSWPTRDQYLALGRSWGDNQAAPLPQGGINSSNVLGVRVDADNEVWALTEKFRDLTEGLNLVVGLKQLEQRGIFWRQPQKRTSQRELRSQKPLGPGTTPAGQPRNKSVFVFRLDRFDTELLPQTSSGGPYDQPDAESNAEPDSGGESGATSVGADDPDAGITGPAGNITGAITGGITGDNMPLTRSITGITGEEAGSTRHVGARAETELAASGPTAAGPASRAAEFTPQATAGWSMDQLEQAVGECLDDLAALDALEQLIDAREQAERDQAERTAATASPRKEPTDPSRRTVAATPAEQPEGPVDTRPESGQPVLAGIDPPAPLKQPDDPRFVGPAAALDGTTLYLPGGRTHRWTARHLGDLAVLAHERSGLRLGWGGGSALPDQGQLWLYPDAIARLGLPAAMDLPDQAFFGDELARAVKELYEPLRDHPAFADAFADGWELQQDRPDAWTRLRHPELLPGGAIVVFAPWWRIEGVPLFGGDPGPAQLADRLHQFANTVEVSYRVNSQTTGLALIDHTRPPRRDASDPMGKTYRLVRNEVPQLPPFLLDRDDRFSSIEGDYRWWRLWQPSTGSARTGLLAGEKALPYVHGYDRNASYLGGWHADLGVEGLRHHVGADARWNGKTSQAGLWLISLWEWDEWGLPDPADSCNARVENKRVWVTTPTLAQLELHGITPTVHEAWIWAKSNRYLDLAAKVIADGRQHPQPAMVQTIKGIYAPTSGKLAERRPWRTAQHLHRPDWYFTIVAQARFAIDLQLTKIKNRPGGGPMPLAVDHDAVFYASSNPDPVAGWPGAPDKLGTGVGQWKPIGTAHLDVWGPKHLADETMVRGQLPTRGWQYRTAADDLTPPGQPLGEAGKR